MTTASTLYDKIWDEHVVHTEDDGTAVLYIDRHLVHEVTSPQAFEGLELAGRKVWRVSANLAVSDHNVPTTGPLARHRRPDLAAAGRHARRQLRSPRHHAVQDERPAPGHRPRDRPGAGRDAAGHDRRLRRLAHLDARRVRRAGARHRHQRGRARAGDADPAGAQGEEHAGAGRRQARRAAAAKDIVLAIIGKIGTAGGTGYTIEFAGAAIRALSMEGPHDGVQHGDRGRRARRPGRGRRDHDRLREGPAPTRRPGWNGSRRCATGARSNRTPTRTGTRWSSSTRQPSPAGHLGHVAGDGASRSRTACPIPSARRTRASATRWSAR